MAGVLPETDFIQGYGMTEAASVLTMLGPEDHRHGGDALASSGRPVFGVELQITDSMGNALPRGEAGEVVCSGRQPHASVLEKAGESPER